MASAEAPAPFICGVARSGTTLLRLMLDAHPHLAIPPETHFLPDLISRMETLDDPAPADALAPIRDQREWEDFGFTESELLDRFGALEPLSATTVARSFFEAYAERHGKRRWGDKTPMYVKRMATIEAVLPEARFVHLIRDGRDVALSRARRGFGKNAGGRRAGQRWRRRILAAREQSQRLPHYLELRYEDLIEDPEGILRRVCDFVKLDYDPAMLRYHERAADRMAEMARDLPGRDGESVRPAEERMAAHAMTQKPPSASRIGVWRTEMSAEDAAEFENAAGDLLAELGYPVQEGSRR
jgi:hypothetical protein